MATEEEAADTGKERGADAAIAVCLCVKASACVWVKISAIRYKVQVLPRSQVHLRVCV